MNAINVTCRNGHPVTIPDVGLPTPEPYFITCRECRDVCGWPALAAKSHYAARLGPGDVTDDYLKVAWGHGTTTYFFHDGEQVYAQVCYGRNGCTR